MRLWVLALCGVTACQPGRSIPLSELPDGIDFIAAVALDARHQALGASPLLAADRPLLFDSSSAASTSLILLGWSADQLAQYPDFDPTLPLVLVEACNPGLPTPSWDLSISNGQPAPGPALSELPRLGVTDTPIGGCAELANAHLVVDNRCATQEVCDYRVQAVGCRIQARSVGPCSPSSLDLTAIGGGLCAQSTGDGSTSCPGAVSADNTITVECQQVASATCAIAVYRDPPVELKLEFDSRELWPGQSVAEPSVEGRVFDHERVARGHIFGLTVVGNSVIVAAPRDPEVIVSWGCVGVPTVLWIFDADTLELTGTSTAPDCTTGIASLPGSDQFFGVSQFLPSTFTIHRFDAHARRIASGGPQPLPLGIEVSGFALSDGGVAVLQGRFQVNDTPQSLSLFDPEHFGLTQRTEFPNPASSQSAKGLIPTPIGLVALDDAANAVRLFGTTGPEADFRGPHAVGYQIVSWYGPGRYFLLGTTGGSLSLFGVGPTKLGEARSIPEHPGSVSGMVALPRDPSRILIAGSEQNRAGDASAFLSLFDAAGFRAIPGTVPIAPGIATKLLADATRNQVLMLLPWSGRLGRARLR